ncbi:MAG: gerAC [Firmicutes bacterium]|nr:gerAC [Bacillota bacterium]
MLKKGHLHTVILAGVIFLMSFMVTGCWDRKEIENRGFVLGGAIDKVITPAPKGEYDLPHVTQEAGERKYKVTVEMPRFKKGEENVTGGKENHYIFSGEGESMFQIVRAIGAKTYFSPFFEDLQVLIFSEAVAREGIKDLLDFGLRNPTMRRGVKVFVTPGRAEDILKGKMQVAEINSIFIAKTSQNVKMTPRFATVTSLGEVAQAIRAKRSFGVAEIVMENGDVKLTKGAIFNAEGKMVGELDEWEIVGGKIIRRVLKEGAFSIPNPANPEKLAVFEVVEPRIKVNSHVDGDKLWFTLEAELAGHLGENTETEQKALDPVFLMAVERAMADEFTRMVQVAYHKHQELRADALGLGSLVYRQHPEYWNMVKDRWDEEVFPQTPIDVNIKVIIRRPGMIS